LTEVKCLSVIIIVSDLHLDDDPKRIDWLMEIMDRHQPRALFSLGDNGVEFDCEKFREEILGRCKFYSIYGNHENMEWLSTLQNFDGAPVLLRDAEVVKVGDLRLGFINGIVSLLRRSKKGVPRKRPKEFLKVARKLSGKIDVLCMHEFPAPDELLNYLTLHAPAYTAREAVQLAHPRVVFCGHIHYRKIEPRVYHIGFMKIIVIDSTEGYYALLHPKELLVEIKRNAEVVFSLKII